MPQPFQLKQKSCLLLPMTGDEQNPNSTTVFYNTILCCDELLATNGSNNSCNHYVFMYIIMMMHHQHGGNHHFRQTKNQTCSNKQNCALKQRDVVKVLISFACQKKAEVFKFFQKSKPCHDDFEMLPKKSHSIFAKSLF